MVITLPRVATTPCQCTTSQQVKGSSESTSRCHPACTTHRLPFPCNSSMSICFNQQTSLFVNNSVPLSEDQYTRSLYFSRDVQSLTTCADDGNIRVSIPTLGCELSLKPLSPLHRISNPTLDSSTVSYPSHLRFPDMVPPYTNSLQPSYRAHSCSIHTRFLPRRPTNCLCLRRWHDARVERERHPQRSYDRVDTGTTTGDRHTYGTTPNQRSQLTLLKPLTIAVVTAA
jgi:hypothetical protein